MPSKSKTLAFKANELEALLWVVRLRLDDIGTDGDALDEAVVLVHLASRLRKALAKLRGEQP